MVSSRPPFGITPVIEGLGLKLPIGAFNGAAIVAPDLSEIETHAVAADVAKEIVGRLTAAGVSVWVFARGRWVIRDPHGPHVDHERHTINHDPTVVADFGEDIAHAGKIVGVSTDPDLLAGCERELAAAYAGRATVARSQAYYLDITPVGLDKGTFLKAISRITEIPMAEIAVFGDRENDIPMLTVAGLSIAMGNGSPAARAAAGHVTASNEEDGVAAGIDRIILAGQD
ncbi:MAG: Cof-type HAD-IIB family hydrolase [Acuticoccus sp.]